MPGHIIKRAARLDVLKRVLGGEAVGRIPARTSSMNFRASDFPLISEALGRTEGAFTNKDVLEGITGSKLGNMADQRNSLISSELSDLLSAAKADANALKNVKNDMGRIMNDEGLHFEEIGPALYSHAGKDVDRVISKRRLRRALMDAERRAAGANKPKFGDIAIGSGLGIAAGLGGTYYLHNRKHRLDDEKVAADYSMAFIQACVRNGYDPKELLKQAQDPQAYNTMLTALTEGYSMDDVKDALEIGNKTLYEYPKLKGTDLHTPGASPTLMDKLKNKEKMQDLVDTIKKLVLG